MSCELWKEVGASGCGLQWFEILFYLTTTICHSPPLLRPLMWAVGWVGSVNSVNKPRGSASRLLSEKNISLYEGCPTRFVPSCVIASNGLIFKLYVCNYKQTMGVRGSTRGWGTVVQAGSSRVRFSMVSLEFFIGIFLPVALWPWGWFSL